MRVKINKKKNLTVDTSIGILLRGDQDEQRAWNYMVSTRF